MPSTNPTRAEADMRNLAKTASLIAIAAVFVLFAALLASLDALPLIEPFARAITTWDWALFGATCVAPAAPSCAPDPDRASTCWPYLARQAFSTRSARASTSRPATSERSVDMGGAMTMGARSGRPSLCPRSSRGPAGSRAGIASISAPRMLVIAIIGREPASSSAACSCGRRNSKPDIGEFV